MGMNPQLLGVGIIFALWDAFGIGANDVANSFATSVNSGVFSMTQVAFIAVIFEFLGAILAGSKVSATIQKGILKPSLFTNKAGLLQLGMVTALMGSASWLQIANWTSLPVSTTHSIVGGVIGVGVACFGIDAINWGFSNVKKINGIDSIPSDGFGPIALSWVISPIVSGVFAAVQFLLTRLFVLDDNIISRRIHSKPFFRAIIMAPFFYAFVGSMLCLLLIYKGGNTVANAGAAAQAAAKNDQLAIGLSSGLVALFLLPLSAVYVSYWQYRTTWLGEDIAGHEYLWFWAIPKRERRKNFDATHLGEPSTAAAIADKTPSADAEVAKPIVDGAESAAATPVNGTAKDGETVVHPHHDEVVAHEFHPAHHVKAADVDVTSVFTKVIEGTPKFHNDVTADMTHVKIVPPEIQAALAIAEKEGYVVREMGESEKVMREYKKICIHGSWLDRLLCPVRGLLCNGIIGADGEEREVRLYHADKMRKYHDAAVKYDEKAEEVFRQLQMLTAIIASFAHGSNDVANAMGPLSSIVGIYQGTGTPTSGYPTPDWMLAVGGIMIGFGFLFYGYHLMRSLGNNLTFHSPSRGYCMEFGAAMTVLIASRIGLPISTTQCITGATIFVGMVSGIRAVNWRRFASIFLSWIFTVPIVAVWSGCIMGWIIYAPNVLTPYVNQGIAPVLNSTTGLPVQYFVMRQMGY